MSDSIHYQCGLTKKGATRPVYATLTKARWVKALGQDMAQKLIDERESVTLSNGTRVHLQTVFIGGE